MKKVVLIIAITLCLVLSLGLCSCRTAEKEDWTSYTAGEFGILNSDHPLVQITFSTGDKVRLELYTEVAPKTVENFIKLAKSGYYEGLTMHRIIENFMIQGGGYVRKSDYLEETSVSADNIYGEFLANGWTKNNVSHRKGVVSMARAVDYDSASSQFFICSVDCTYLDGSYCAFGRVIDEESMTAVVRISKVATDTFRLKVGSRYTTLTDVPVQPIDIVKVEVQD